MKTDAVNPATRFLGVVLSSNAVDLPEGATTNADFFRRLADGEPFNLVFVEDEGELVGPNSATIEIDGIKRQGGDLMIAFKITGDAPEGVTTKQTVTLLFKEGRRIDGMPPSLISDAWTPPAEG